MHVPKSRIVTNCYLGPIIELLEQKKLLNNFLLLAEMSRIPVVDCTCDMIVWLVTLFW